MKTMILISIGVAALVGLLSLFDMILGFLGRSESAPFAGQVTMDIMFLVATGLIAWMGFESLQEQK